MKVGDLVKVVYDGATGIVARIEGGPVSPVWVALHTGEYFKADKLEVISEHR